VTPPSDWCAGDAEHPHAAMWPESAVTVPQGGGVDRVVVFMSRVCLGNSFLEIRAMGMSVAETTYGGGSLDGVPITGTITNLNFAGVSRAWGTAAHFDGSHVYAYQCSRPVDGGGVPSDYGPCRVARVAPASVASVAAWRYWNGGDWTQAGSWVSDPAQAVAMNLPADVGPVPTVVPVASFTVTRDAVHGVWVMAYVAYPGLSSMVFARVATTPVGPWSAPVQIDLPGCGGDGNWCYAGSAQPKFSTAGHLGFGYMDMSYDADLTRSQYMVATTPFTVVP
jgi:hypothetical protein